MEKLIIEISKKDLYLLCKALELARDKTRSDYDYDLYDEMLKNIKEQSKEGTRSEETK